MRGRKKGEFNRTRSRGAGWTIQESLEQPTHSRVTVSEAVRSARADKAELLAAAIEAAEQVATQAYAPYSSFAVGAALITKSGRIFSGCNVENASYGLTICAERNAIFRAVAEGERQFETLVIYTPTDRFTGPCGACRQVMAEFAPKLEVIMVNKKGRVRRTSLARLLPDQFK
jgi:cytidine deaminase